MEAMPRIAATICLAIVSCAAGTTVFAQFTTIYNLPPDQIPDPYFNRQILTPNTQVNVYPTGSIGPNEKVGGRDEFDQWVPNIEVNLLGGYIDSGTQFYPGTRFNLYSGTINGRFSISENSVANVYGGNAGQFIGIGGTLNMSGGLIEYSVSLFGKLNM